MVVIEKLAEEFTSGSGARDINRTIFVVGDKNSRSIRFRVLIRANSTGEEKFATKLNASQQAFQSTALEYSFRSSPAILRCVDHVFAQASKAGFTEQATHKAFPPPCLAVSTFGPLFRLVSPKMKVNGKTPLILWVVQARQDMAQSIARNFQIAKL